jgi:hypothetical protein
MRSSVLFHISYYRERSRRSQRMYVAARKWSQWRTNVLQDYEYLSPIIKEIEAAAKERADLESMKVQRK